jgi:hypothetical protein
MKLNLGNEIIYRNKDDVNNLYPQVLWDLSLDCDLDISAELSRDDIWDYSTVLQGVGRARYNRNSDILNNFCAEFAFFKESILTAAYNVKDGIFQFSWYKDFDFYLKTSHLVIAIFKDMPGFSMNPHLDNNHIMVQLVINLKDNCASTKFYPFNSKEPFYVSSTKQNQGAMFLNTPGSVHDISDVTEDRYILYASIVFDIY